MLCGSFHGTPPKRKNVYYKVTKEKDQMIFLQMVFFVIQGVKFKNFEYVSK